MSSVTLGQQGCSRDSPDSEAQPEDTTNAVAAAVLRPPASKISTAAPRSAKIFAITVAVEKRRNAPVATSRPATLNAPRAPAAVAVKAAEWPFGRDRFARPRLVANSTMSLCGQTPPYGSRAGR